MKDSESSGSGSASAGGGSASGKVKTGPLSSAVDQLVDTMGKSEKHLSADHRKLLAQQKLTVASALAGFEEDQDRFMKEVLDLAAAHSTPKE